MSLSLYHGAIRQLLLLKLCSISNMVTDDSYVIQQTVYVRRAVCRPTAAVIASLNCVTRAAGPQLTRARSYFLPANAVQCAPLIRNLCSPCNERNKTHP